MNVVQKNRAGAAIWNLQDIDRHVGTRIRERRIILGITQQQMAELIGVTPQQTQKYELGSNRISAGRLYKIANALGVDFAFFFEGLDEDNEVELPQRRLLLEFARNFVAVANSEHQEMLCSLTRALANEAEKYSRPPNNKDDSIMRTLDSF